MRKLQRKLKKFALTVATRPMRRAGFSKFGARLWLREIARDRRLLVPSAKRRKAHKAGFALGVYQNLDACDRAVAVSQRDYLFLHPLQKTQNWLTNRVVARRFIPGLSLHFPDTICTVFGTRNRLDIVRLNTYPDDLTQDEAGLLELFRRFQAVQVVPIRWDRGIGRIISWNSETLAFAIDGWPATEETVLDTVTGMTARERCAFFVADDLDEQFGSQIGVESARLRFFVAKPNSDEALVTDAEFIAGDTWRPTHPTDEEIDYARKELNVRKGWSRRRSRLSFREERHDLMAPIDIADGTFRLDDSSEFPQQDVLSVPGFSQAIAQIQSIFSQEQARFRFISIDVVFDANGSFVLRDLSTFPRYPRRRVLSPATDEHLAVLLSEKQQKVTSSKRQSASLRSTRANARRLRRRVQAFQLRSQGFTSRMARAWIRRVDRDRRRNASTSAQMRDQAYEWGFLPETVKRFGITEENRADFVSERDYRFVQPLNGKYGKWVRDRVSALTVFEPHSELFETTHYQIVRRDTVLQVIPLSQEAREFGVSLGDLARFLSVHGPLVLASSAWSGRTFTSVSYEEPNFIVDAMMYSLDEFEKLLKYRVRDQFYVLVEPAELDSFITSSSSSAESEIQISMMNPSGSYPRIAEAFVVATDEVFESDISKLIDDDGTADAGIEADLARAEHREDVGISNQLGDLDDARVENDTEDDDEQTVRQKFFARIDIGTGRYDGAKTVLSGRVEDIPLHPSTGLPFKGVVPDWDQLVKSLEELCHFAPQLAFIEFRIILGERGPKIRGISATPTYSTIFPFSAETREFLQGVVDEKAERESKLLTRVETWFQNGKRTIRKRFALLLYPEGLVPYQSVRWLGDIRRDFLERNGVSLRTKIWAYRNGFLSYRIPQYGITPENREEFISDLEYRWLRHINKKYKYWLEDKISIKYVAAKHNECLPEYYFYTSLHGGVNHVIPMMDCPEGYDASFDEILRLARDKGVLALKPDEGSHGEGFFRLAYDDGEYSLNGEVATELRVLEILQSTANQYLVTEFIVMHPVISEIYPNSVNTIRMIVFKKDGVTAEIGNAYMRIGSLKSGYVDNTAAGGMLAKIDVDTGRFGDGQALEHGRVTPCPVHPDTGVLIEGTVPNWEFAKRKVLEIAADLPQLEYLGFDLAITEDGIKLPEINRSPDYPRIDLLTPATIDYLLYKLESKKKLFGYDRNPPRKLISLPRRSA